MLLNQFKELIENSNGEMIVLNSDVIFKEELDDFCENGIQTVISIPHDLIIDGNGHVIDINGEHCKINLKHANLTLKNIHFRNNNIYFSNMNSNIVLENCKLTGSCIDGSVGRLSIRNCNIEKDSKILIGGKLEIDNCLLEDNRDVLKINGFTVIKNSTFKNNTSPIYSNWSSDTTLNIQNTTFEDNIGIIVNLRFGNLYLMNCTFNDDASDIIICRDKMNVENCRFRKHHLINGESVFEVSKKESEFMVELEKINR